MRLHVRDHFPHPEEATVLVHTQNLAPVLGAAVVHGVIDGDAGVVYENIHPPVRRHYVGHHSFPVLFLRHVQLYPGHAGRKDARRVA